MRIRYALRLFRAISLVGLLIISTTVDGSEPLADSMRYETQRFLASMPEGLQKAQTDAVCQAMSGDCSALDAVRNSRNAKYELPEGVTAQNIGDAYRLYRPVGKEKAVLPLLIYLHGGGWCFGSVNSCAHFCVQLVKKAGLAVLAVEYPLSPEHPFPVALNACSDAVSFAREHAEDYRFNLEKISIGGDSAGGNLALATVLNLLMQKNSTAENASCVQSSIESLVLFYPVTKAWADGSASWQNYASGYGLDAELMNAFNAAYAEKINARHPLVSPIMASEDLLRQFPRTLVVSAECDILFSQGEELAQKLSSLGVPVCHQILPSTVHLFITVPGQPSAFKQSVRIAADFLK